MLLPLPLPRLGLVALGVVPFVAFSSRPLATILVGNAVVVVVWLIDIALAGSPSHITVERKVPVVVPLGMADELTWSFRNLSKRAHRVAIADSIPPSFGATRRRVRTDVAPGVIVRMSTEVRPGRRGDIALDDMVVRCIGPLGLGARQQRRHMRTVVRVLPAFKSKKEADLRLRRSQLLEIGLRSAQGRGGGTEFDSLRTYQFDDETKRIDWAATARSRDTIVRTYRAERNQQIIILLDLGRVMAGQVAGVTRLEHAMDAAMALTSVASRLGDRCGMVAFDRRVQAVLRPAAGRAQLQRLTDTMYSLQPALVESDYQGAFLETMVRFRRRSLIVLLTDLSKTSIVESVLPQVPPLLRRNLVISASVSDPEVGGWATQSPSDPSEAFRKVSSVAALADRASTAKRLHLAGSAVVDAEPGFLAARLIDAYLDTKSTGRL
jgi:uncharacterized protein (DUF58 family)